MSASKSDLIKKLLADSAGFTFVKKENDAAGSSSEKNAASEKEKEKDASKSAAFTFVKKEKDAAFVKKVKHEEAEVAY